MCLHSLQTRIYTSRPRAPSRRTLVPSRTPPTPVRTPTNRTLDPPGTTPPCTSSPSTRLIGSGLAGLPHPLLIRTHRYTHRTHVNRGMLGGKCCRYMQVSGEILAKVVKSAVGMCRLVVKQTQKWLKVLSVYAVLWGNRLRSDQIA